MSFSSSDEIFMKNWNRLLLQKFPKIANVSALDEVKGRYKVALKKPVKKLIYENTILK